MRTTTTTATQLDYAAPPARGSRWGADTAIAAGCIGAAVAAFCVGGWHESPVIAYEPLENHGEWASFLFNDGHVERIEKKRAAQVIADLKAGRNPPGSGK